MAEGKLFRVEVSVPVYVIAHDEAGAERVAREHAPNELRDNGPASSDAYEVRHMSDISGDWRRALPYGDNKHKKTCAWWVKRLVGAV